MFKRLLRSRTSENVMAVDELIDSAMRTRVKPDTEKTGVGGKKLGDGVIYPFGAENEAPNGKNSASNGMTCSAIYWLTASSVGATRSDIPRSMECSLWVQANGMGETGEGAVERLF